MKRIRLAIVFVMLCAVLVGCSGNIGPDQDITIKWDNGIMTFPKGATSLSSYSGDEAVAEYGGASYQFTFEQADDLTWISVNTQGIEEMNMDDYKTAKFYTEYLGSQMTMCYPIGKDNYWIICHGPDDASTHQTLLVQMYNWLSNMDMTMGQVYVNFEDKFIFGNDYDYVTVRPDGAVITGLIKVSKDSKPECQTPFVVTQGKKEYTLMKYSSSSYDYYMYEGFLIQVALGMDITNYIEFK